MKKKPLTSERLARYLDEILRVGAIPDDSMNGLQVANSGKLTAVASAVDASAASIRKAAESKADFLIVHHGLFWGKPVPLTGPMRDRVRLLIESDIALYACHLPLDLHPELGNNIRLCREMGWNTSFEFGDYHGVTIGRGVVPRRPVPLEDLARRLQETTGAEPVVWRFGPSRAKRIAVISGGAMSMLEQVASSGFDTFLTGEFRHSSYWFAKEAGINVVFGGHYATETFGVRALGERIRSDFGLETGFLDLPTGY